MKKIITLNALLLVCAFAYSQNYVTGVLTKITNQQLYLAGYNGFDTYVIDSVKASEKGDFNLSFGNKDYGMGYLLAEDGKTFIVILAEYENLKLWGETPGLPETIEIIEGKQNRLFEQYASEHQRREQTLSAWDFLAKIYSKDSLFAIHEIPQQAIEEEKQRIKAEDILFLSSIPNDLYVRWYLSLRKLVTSVTTIAQNRTKEIPASIAEFRKINYADPRLYKSGLLRDVIESHFWLIENSGRSLDSVYIEMKVSIDQMIEVLLADGEKLNKTCEYLFKFLEKRSLFDASEYLALKLLNEKSCTITDDFAAQLECYRAMKTGNIAHDIDFKKDIFSPGNEACSQPKKLSDLRSKYTVVIFGASWCPQCQEELSNIARLYEKWKKNGLEVVFISLDKDEKIFKNFTSVFPFICICDYLEWESPVAKSYHVFATPTIYLLDDKQQILLRPNSVSHLDSWIDWYLVEKNN